MISKQLTHQQDVLDNDKAWMALPKPVRQDLYKQLPTVGPHPHDVEINPLHTALRPYMQDAILSWQEDLREGRESKKWRQEAIDTGKERESGKFDEYRIAHKEEWWGNGTTDTSSKMEGETASIANASLLDDNALDTEPSSSSAMDEVNKAGEDMDSSSRTTTSNGHSILVPSTQ